MEQRCKIVLATCFITCNTPAQAAAPLSLTPVMQSPATPASAPLRGSRIYVYNFLDIREDNYRAEVLQQFEQQLTAALAKSAVSLSLLRFKQTPAALGFANTTGGAMIPVAKIVEENSAAEVKADATYRLIIFPSNYESTGAWRFYSVRWMLMDIKSGKIIWAEEYKGKHLVIFKEKENAESRARKLVEFAISALQQNKLI